MHQPVSNWLRKLAGLGFYGGYDVCGKLEIPFVIAAVQPLAICSFPL